MRTFPASEQYRYLSIGDIRPAGWMKQQMQDDLNDGFAGRLDELSPRTSSRAFTVNHTTSLEATEAGMIEDTPRSWWDGETQAVWWDGLVRMSYLSGHSDTMKKVDVIMAELLQSQDESGYIGIYTEKFRYRHTKENGEFWTQSRAFTAMLAYYELTDKVEYLEAVEKAINVTMAEYGPHRSYFGNETPAGGTCHGLMMVDVCEWLFRLTENKKYRDYGVWCYADYCRTKEVRDTDNQIDHLLMLHEGFVWHTPHTTEHLRVPLWSAYASGEAQYRKAAENAFHKIERYLTPSGACIGSESIKNLPPLPDMTYEYCAITELLTSLQSACQKTGLAEFADMTESLAFNAAQGARLADGTGINYMSLDNRFEATTEGNGGRRKFSPTHEEIAVCCNPNAVKLLPYYTNRMWLRLTDTEGVCALCYGPSDLNTTIHGVSVRIQQKTNYPFSETMTFEVSPDTPVEFELRMRIPGWAQDYTLAAGDAEITEKDAFCCISKVWKAEDSITIAFQCDVEPLIACNGEVAVRRGPLLYSLPIASESKVLRKYDVPGFVDMAFTPKGNVQNLLIDSEDLDFTHNQIAEADLSHPWHKAPVVLKGTLHNEEGDSYPVSLEPMGCTILRQTTFSPNTKR